MLDPKTTLLIPLCRAAATAPADATWSALRAAIDATGEPDASLRSAVASRDVAELQKLIAEWDASKRPLPEQDRAVFQRAMKAFRKRLKLTRLDAESSIGGGPMSSGRSSGIVAVQPPNQYPHVIWEELVRCGRLLDAGNGMFELPPE